MISLGTNKLLARIVQLETDSPVSNIRSKACEAKMEKPGLFVIALSVLVSLFLQVWMYLLILGGLWLVLSSREPTSLADRICRAFGILSLGIGVGVVSTMLAP